MATRLVDEPVRTRTRERLGPPVKQEASFSIPSILAIVAAVASFPAGVVLGTVLALVAIGLGLLGAGLALKSDVRGGVISVLAVLAGIAGVIAAIVKLVMLAF